MKTKLFQKTVATMAVAGLAWSASTVVAQDSSAASTVQPAAAAGESAPQLAYGVPQVLQLVQAKVNDATVIAYIKNSGNSYGLNADQIIYLRQQGVSDAVISTMLNQPRPGVAAATPATPAPQPEASTADSGQVSTATVAPTVTYVQTVPETTYYQPYYQPYYYPYYAWYPPVSFSFGWGGGYYRGGWHGGYGGGWHGGGYGGGFHGGGGGWHGGGGGFHGGGHR